MKTETLLYHVTLYILVPFIFVIGDELEQIARMYDNELEAAKTYQLPHNAQQYRPASPKSEPSFFGTYDYIVIGAGAGGSVMANRLSEMPEWNVLVLEAGTMPNNATDLPLLYLPHQFSKYNWGFVSTPQTTCCLGMKEQRCAIPRGRMCGGATGINGLMYNRGYGSDFDNWSRLVGDPKWSYKNVLPYFKKSERFGRRNADGIVDDAAHGTDGLQNVENHFPTSPQTLAWLRANEELGQPMVDCNNNKLGVNLLQLMELNGRRQDACTAFLLPIIKRENLKIITSSYVTHINWKFAKNGRLHAISVEFTWNGNWYTAKVEREVILSAGAIQSPQVLMLSGIGPRAHLRSMKIRVRKDLPVGRNYRNHPTVCGLSFETNATAPKKSSIELAAEYLKGKGEFTLAGNNQAEGFYTSSYSAKLKVPDFELVALVAPSSGPLLPRSFRWTKETEHDVTHNVNAQNAFSLFITLLHVESTGSVTLKSADPFEYPLVDNNYLSDTQNHDIQILYEAVQLAMKLTRTEPLKGIATKLVSGPVRQCSELNENIKEYWYCAIRHLTADLYHPVSTCQMSKSSREGVVDSNAKVFGTANVRVVDASVFPQTLAGHPVAAVYMVAEVITDIIKREQGKCF